MSLMGEQISVTPASTLALAGRQAVVMLLLVHMVVACSSSGGAAGGGSRNRGNDLQGHWSALCSRGSGWRTGRTSSLAALVVAVTAAGLVGWLRRGGLCRHKMGGKGSGEGLLDGLGE